MENFFKNKRILITGACGTVGRELTRQMLEIYHAEELICFDNNESELFCMEQKFSTYSQAHFFLGDVRDLAKLTRKMKGIDVVFHTAAFKHVIVCERSPFDAVQTNIYGVQNVILSALENRVQRIIFTSSDKAVNPTNVMGTSKLMGERLMTAANSNSWPQGSVFASTRFGNVLGSRGSVIPIFREQIRRGGPVTLTHPDMTRFIMSIREAVQLVIDSAVLAKGGEIFVTKMPVIRIRDLAEVMIKELAPEFGFSPRQIDIVNIGPKAGEKMYEELLNQEETRRAIELEKFFVVFPAFSSIYHSIEYTYEDIRSKKIEKPYNSNGEIPLKSSELAIFLKENELLLEDPTN